MQVFCFFLNKFWFSFLSTETTLCYAGSLCVNRWHIVFWRSRTWQLYLVASPLQQGHIEYCLVLPLCSKSALKSLRKLWLAFESDWVVSDLAQLLHCISSIFAFISCVPSQHRLCCLDVTDSYRGSDRRSVMVFAVTRGSLNQQCAHAANTIDCFRHCSKTCNFNSSLFLLSRVAWLFRLIVSCALTTFVNNNNNEVDNK